MMGIEMPYACYGGTSGNTGVVSYRHAYFRKSTEFLPDVA